MTARRGPVAAGLMLSMALAAIDGTIVATAVPSIVRDLGQFSLFPWVIAGYMLAQAVCTPIYGRLADQFGRKPMIATGMVIFLVGSLLAGLAWSMPVLIVARVVQGVGAGAIQSIVQTIAADLYPLEERGKISGLLSSVWGVSALVGPAVGGLLAELASWRWIFLANLPVGAAAIAAIVVFLTEDVERRPARIDVPGALLLAAGVVALMLGLQESAWWLVAAGVAVLAGFGWWERRAKEPIIPPWVWRDRVLLGSFLGSAVVGMVLVGPSVYLPTFAQGVLGAGVIAAGFALAVQSIGWPISVALSSRLYMRIGFRDTALCGLVLILVSAVMFVFMRPSVLYAGVCSFVNGAGLGLLSVSMLLGAQNTVGWERRGVVTGSVIFFRIGGGALGTAVLAGVANSTLAGHGSVDEAARALQRGGEGLEQVRQALAEAVHNVFVGMLVIVLSGVMAVLILPRRVPGR
ncbi:MFS transporter [Nonomuraea soli]|uniref:EmrB/QacA subfamily drug resistance transporter n=1 Tax=Nonomuraea soli TaxID=1032476 RepID=A0A7W0CP76_9ACTN|nr:MFS transporter [Nonomuraea soli]MBA2894777.1 EmrB/QacA subfamily drug resistance transporter [Nonomuraea soli]